jgi:hypothetical protein
MMVTAVSALSSQITFIDIYEGAAVAKFAANNLHQKLVLGEDYHEKRYGAALKRAFLAIDEDLLASEFERYKGINLHYIVSPRLSHRLRAHDFRREHGSGGTGYPVRKNICCALLSYY